MSAIAFRSHSSKSLRFRAAFLTTEEHSRLRVLAATGLAAGFASSHFCCERLVWTSGWFSWDLDEVLDERRETFVEAAGVTRSTIVVDGSGRNKRAEGEEEERWAELAVYIGPAGAPRDRADQPARNSNFRIREFTLVHLPDMSQSDIRKSRFRRLC